MVKMTKMKKKLKREDASVIRDKCNGKYSKK